MSKPIRAWKMRDGSWVEFADSTYNGKVGEWDPPFDDLNGSWTLQYWKDHYPNEGAEIERCLKRIPDWVNIDSFRPKDAAIWLPTEVETCPVWQTIATYPGRYSSERDVLAAKPWYFTQRRAECAKHKTWPMCERHKNQMIMAVKVDEHRMVMAWACPHHFTPSDEACHNRIMKIWSLS